MGPPDSLRKKWGGGPPTQSLAVCPSALPEHGEAEQLSLSFAVAPPPRREEVLTPSSSSRTTLSQWDSSSSSSSSQAELRPPPDWPVVLGVRESGGGWGPRPMPLDRRAGTALSRRGIGCRLHFGNLKLGFFLPKAKKSAPRLPRGVPASCAISLSLGESPPGPGGTLPPEWGAPPLSVSPSLCDAGPPRR